MRITAYSMKEIEIYKLPDNRIELQVNLENETVWFTQKQMPILFDKNLMNVNKHVENIYTENELEEVSTIRKSLIVETEGKRAVKREVLIYNLDVIISVGYRVNLKRATQFRQWATRRLQNHLVNYEFTA